MNTWMRWSLLAKLGASFAPSLRTTVLIVLAGAGARVVALTLNRIIDRRIDEHGPAIVIAKEIAAP